MMKSIIVSILFVAVSLVSANQQPGDVVSHVQAVPVSAQPPQSPVQVVGAPQSAPVVGSQPVEVGVLPTPVHHHHDQNGVHTQVHGEHHLGETHHVGENHVDHSPASGASYYSPAGIIQAVGEQQQPKPGQSVQGVQGVRNFEQYGHPESASIPANYKPFGSWGLYIGGNPADGYYTNYYKALGNSVEKQQQLQQAGEVKPSVVGGQQVVGQSAAFSPILKQAGSSPYNGADYYPFAYSTSDFSSLNRVPQLVGAGVEHHPGQVQPAGYVLGGQQQPSPAVPQVYSGAFEQPNPQPLSYSADTYASTKKLGQSTFAQREVKEPQQQAKGYRYSYVQYPQQAAAPVAPQPAVPHQPAQVVAYPVPVGSQIVGSQPGVDGAFAPYGVHAFTRYAVKPAVVQSPAEYQSYYYSVPAYKQQPQYAYQPFGFYGYPLSQLHYSGSLPSGSPSSSQSSSPISSGSPVPQPPHYAAGILPQPEVVDQPISPVHPGQGVAHSIVPQVEGSASEKSEREDKSQANKQNKRA